MLQLMLKEKLVIPLSGSFLISLDVGLKSLKFYYCHRHMLGIYGVICSLYLEKSVLFSNHVTKLKSKSNS